MKYLYRALWLIAAFSGGLSVIGSVWVLLEKTKKKYIDVL